VKKTRLPNELESTIDSESPVRSPGKASAAHRRYFNVTPPPTSRLPAVQCKADERRATAAASKANTGWANLFEGIVQAKGQLEGDGVHAVAAQGLQGSAGAMPHRAAIQRSFGHHDVSGIRAHSGAEADDACAALGAQAFAVDNSVAFGGAPSLHTAAHEAAHVIQQRGGVQLKGGVGQEGDRYEQHADRVADLVVQGKSAESTLDELSGGAGATQANAVQMKGKRGRAWRRKQDKKQGENQLVVAEEAEEKKEKKPKTEVSVPGFAKRRMKRAADRIKLILRGWKDVRGRPDATRMLRIKVKLNKAWQRLRDEIGKARTEFLSGEDAAWLKKHGTVVPAFNNDARWLKYMRDQLGGDNLQYLRELDAFGSWRSVSGAITEELNLSDLDIGHKYELYAVDVVEAFTGKVGAIFGTWELRYSNKLGMTWTQSLRLKIVVGGLGGAGASGSQESKNRKNVLYGKSVSVGDYFSPADFDNAELHYLKVSVGMGGLSAGPAYITFKHHNASVRFNNSGVSASHGTGRKPGAKAVAGRGDASRLGVPTDTKGLGPVKPVPIPKKKTPPKKKIPAKAAWKDVIVAGLHFPTPKNHRAPVVLDDEDAYTLEALVGVMSTRATRNWDDKIRILIVGQSSERYRKPKKGETRDGSNLIIAEKRAKAVKNALLAELADAVGRKQVPASYLTSAIKIMPVQPGNGQVDVGAKNNDPSKRSSQVYVQYHTTRRYEYEDQKKK